MINVVLFCGSSGAIEEFQSLIELLPSDFNAAVVLLLHRKNNINDYLSEVLNRRSKLPVHEIEHLMKIESGNIYVVPGGYHCLLNLNLEFELDYSETEAFCRPAADVSLESFSYVLRDKLIAVIVSGANNDSAQGIGYVEKRNGKLIIQDPKKAKYNSMPSAALSKVKNATIAENGTEIYSLVKLITNGESKNFDYRRQA